MKKLLAIDSSWKIKLIIKNLDLIASSFALVIGLILVYLCFRKGLQQIDIALTILIASLFYIFKRTELRQNPNHLVEIKPILTYLINLLFYICLILSIYLIESKLYYRPFSYFLITPFLSGLIALESFSLAKTRTPLLIILKIMLLSATIRASIFYNFPSISGYDAYFHARISELITSTGLIQPLDIAGKYASTPLFHIFISVSQIMVNVDIKNAIFLSIGLASIFNSLFIYLITKKIFDSRIGLLSLLLFNLTNVIIVRGIANITADSLVLCYFLMIFFLFIKQTNDSEKKILSIFIAIAMIVTHQLSTFVSIIAFASMNIGSNVYNYINQCNKKSSPTINFLILFFISMVFYWINIEDSKNISFFDSITGPLIRVIMSGGEFNPNRLITGYEYARPFYQTTFLHLSYLLLPFFGIGGVFLLLSRNNRKEFLIAFSIVSLFIIIYMIPMLGIRNFLTDRWMPFLSIYLIISASFYIDKVARLPQLYLYKFFVIFLIVIIYAFFMITTPAINKDSPIISKNETIRTQFKANEIDAANKILNMNFKQIKSDSLFNELLIYKRGLGLGSYSDIYNSTLGLGGGAMFDEFDNNYISSPPREKIDTMIILRFCLLDEPALIKASSLYGDSKAQFLTKGFLNKINMLDYNYVYNSDYIRGYLAT